MLEGLLMREESMMKWRVRKEDRFEHEDIQRSLEVLDNVLAEFDDCLESLESSHFSHIPFDLSFKLNRCAESEQCEELNTFGNRSSSSEFTFKDGRFSPISDKEQEIVSSPPPIPKRSPTTQLSENLNSSSVFLFDGRLSQAFESGDNNAILSSPKRVRKQISPLSIPKKNSDFHNTMDESVVCFKCGQHKVSGRDTEVLKELNYKTNSLNNKKQSFSSFNSLKLSSEASDMHGISDSVYCEEKIYPNKNVLSTEFQHSINGTYKQRIEQLNIKFQRVRELIHKNKIIPLDKSPPTFIPETPTTKNEFFENNQCKIRHKSKLSASVSYPDFRDLIDENMSFDSLPNYTNLSIDNDIYENSPNSNSSCSSWTHSSNLCYKCSCSGQSPTIEDIPNLLPTDVLVRPQFGLSYSLEDDLSPGVKEIQKTSTPKSDVTSNSLFKVKESSGQLSTFSNSTSSLGYVSSQSELELNNLSEIPNKVPMATFKSVTLPNGLDRFPFYSSSQDPRKMPDSKQLSDVSQPIRNSSLELLSTEKPKKNVFSFSRFSRKDKKSVKK